MHNQLIYPLKNQWWWEGFNKDLEWGHLLDPQSDNSDLPFRGNHLKLNKMSTNKQTNNHNRNYKKM